MKNKKTMIPNNFIRKLGKCLKYYAFLYIIIVCFIGFKVTNFKPKYKIHSNHPCLNIEDVSNNDTFIFVKMKNNILRQNPLNISRHFGYFTEVYGMPLLMPPGSAYRTSIVNDTLSLSFPIPFLSHFSGLFFCVDENIYNEPPFQLPLFNKSGVIYEKHINLSINEFRSDIDGSQMLCHGDRFENRWCEATHMGMANEKLVMQTQAHFSFPSLFLSLGGRAPPFDQVNERISNEPLLTKRNIAEISVGVAANNEIAILAAPGAKRNEYSSIIFDFLIPAYQTINFMHFNDLYCFKSNNLSTKKECKKIRFFFHDSENKDNVELIQAITGEPPISPPSFESLTIFENIVLGLNKGDKECDGTRSEFAKYGSVYNYNSNNTKGFRDYILKHFNIKTKYKYDIFHNKTNDNSTVVLNHIYVTFLTTENKDLEIYNLEPLRRLVENSCPFCHVDTFSIDTPNIVSIIEKISKTNVLIGRSGLGLEHSVWLQPKSHVIELRPFHFWCDDKNEIASKISQSYYHSIMNKGHFEDLNKFGGALLKRKKVKNCFSAPSFCESPECYDILLNQQFEMEMDTFNETWNSVLAQIRKQFS